MPRQSIFLKEEFSKNGQILTGVYYLHSDHLGTASYVTNEIADPTQFFLNLPFGETMIEQQEPTAYVNPYKFNAKELDSETGLYYYGARYYNPRISIWYGVDPLAVYNPVMENQFYGDGQHNGGVFNWGNLNPYIYCYQNPIIFVDPNGKQSYFMGNNGFYMQGDSSWGAYMGSIRPGDNYHELTRINGNLYHKNITNPVTKIWNNVFDTNHVVNKDFSSASENMSDEFQANVYGWVAGVGASKLLGGVVGSLLSKAGGSIWKIAPFERGFVYETLLGLKGAFRTSNFPVIDAFANGVATSIKTLNLGAKSYSKNNQVYNTLKGYINKLSKFNGASWGGDVVEGAAIKSKVLEVGIPQGATSSQINQINRAIQYGKENGIQVNVRVVK